MTYIFDAQLGEGVREYGEKEVRNINTLIHSFYPPRYAFPFQQINIIAQKRIPDVSFYQKAIDWDKFRTNTDAVIIRAGQGAGVDDYFFINYTAAHKRGMLRGVYWFYDGRISPGAQADLLVSLLRDQEPETDIWIDWERSYSGGFEGLPNVVAMLQRVELLLPGAKVGMYTGYYWFVGNSNPITHASQYTYLKTRPLWLAWYTSDMAIVKIPNPWSALQLWQFGTPAQGVQYGVATQEIDMSYFNGTEADFYAQYGTATPPPTGETMTLYGRNKTTLTNIRNGPAGTYTDIGDLLLGDLVEADKKDPTGVWWHLTKITRNGANVTLPGVESWAWGVNIEELTAPGTLTYPELNITIDAGTAYPVTKVNIKPL